MQNVIVNVLLITSLLRTSLMHNDYYFKAQFWASLVSHSPLWIFHQKLVATNRIQLLLSPSFPDHGFCNWRVYNNLMLQCSNLFFCYNVFFQLMEITPNGQNSRLAVWLVAKGFRLAQEVAPIHPLNMGERIARLMGALWKQRSAT